MRTVKLGLTSTVGDEGESPIILNVETEVIVDEDNAKQAGADASAFILEFLDGFTNA